MLSTKGLKTERLTKEKILQLVPEYALWCHYSGINIKFGKKYISPVRNESDPSAVFFISYSGSILLKDYGDKVYTLWNFLKVKLNLNYLEVIKRIDSDFGLQYYTDEKYAVMSCNELIEHFKAPQHVIPERTRIYLKRKKWNHLELQFWKDYHISKEILDFYCISPLKTFWIVKSDKLYEYSSKKDELVFVFDFSEDKYKIYKPFAELKKDKWKNNCRSDTLMGLNQLPWISDTLIITKGMKELLILAELGYTAVALQGENNYPSQELYNQLDTRFESIYYLGDIDLVGKKASNEMKNRYNLKLINLPDSTEYKDLADFSKLKGLEQVRNLIQQQI